MAEQTSLTAKKRAKQRSANKGWLAMRSSMTDKEYRELSAKGGRAALKNHPNRMREMANKRWAAYRAAQQAQNKRGAAA